MFRKKPEIDWQFLSEEERDESWPREPQALDSSTRPVRDWRLRRTILLSVAMTILLTVGIGAAYARQEALKGVKAIEQDVQTAVKVEQWAHQNAPELSADTLVDGEASTDVNQTVRKEQSVLAAFASGGLPDPALHIQETWFKDDIAAAKLTLSTPARDGNAPVDFRQTRFYRETGQGWLRTRPDPSLWGSSLTLETDNLLWQYRRRDHVAVTHIADQIDSVYVKLLRDYGLKQSAGEEKLVIQIRVDAVPGLILLYDSPAESIVVTSPSVHLVPVDRTDAEILAQTVALALLKHMWAQAVAQHDISESWPSMAGVSLWELWEMGLSLSEWQDEVVQWVFGDIASYAGNSEIKLPARYRDLCAAHGTYMTTPIAIGIPLSCDEDNDSGPIHDNVLLVGLHGDNLTTLQAVYLHSTIPATVQLGHPIIAYTVVDYAVTVYGRERLPDLVAALGQYDRWETLVPAVYGVSLGEFEQGWREHVAALGQ